MCEFDQSWVKWVDPVVLLWKPEDRDYKRPSYMKWTEKDKPKYTPEKELDMITKQVIESDGFDNDFRDFHCVFSYHPAQLDGNQFTDESSGTTDEDHLKRLAKKAIDDHNQENSTKFEFVKVVKANFYFAAAIMYLITFQVKDPYDDKIKLFQTRVRHAGNVMTKYVFCRPKPNQEVECIGIKKDVVQKHSLED